MNIRNCDILFNPRTAQRFEVRRVCNETASLRVLDPNQKWYHRLARWLGIRTMPPIDIKVTDRFLVVGTAYHDSDFDWDEDEDEDGCV